MILVGIPDITTSIIPKKELEKELKTDLAVMLSLRKAILGEDLAFAKSRAGEF